MIKTNHENTIIRTTEHEYVHTDSGNVWLKKSKEEYLLTLKVQFPSVAAGNEG